MLAALESYLASHPVAFRVYLAPGADEAVGPALGRASFPGITLCTGAPPAENAGEPAILAVAPGDLRGPDRSRLLALANAWRPARPVLLGGARHRDVLLDAINNWRVLRVVSDGAPVTVVRDALRKAHDALVTELGLERATVELRVESDRLEQAIASLRSARGRLVHAERMATLGQATAGLIPIIRRHLAPLDDLKASPGLHRIEDAQTRRLLGYAFSGVAALHGMLDEIRGFAESRSHALDIEVLEVDPIVDFAVAFSRLDPETSSRAVGVRLDARARARIDRRRLTQVLVNLIRNACQATEPGGRIEIRSSRVGGDVVIEVEDSGHGIADEIHARLFEPFFTTKGAEGMGLGLAMSRSAVERHGGTLTCSGAPGRGACFTIRIPEAPSR